MQLRVMVKFSYLKFKARKFPELCLKIDSSTISAEKFLLKKTAQPLACDEKLEK
jgi:hypothetical protein